MKKRMTAWILAAILILYLLPVCVLAAGEGSYSISNQTVSAGEEFSMDVSLSGNPGIISLRFQVAYDESVLQLVRVTDQGLLNGFTTPAPDIASPYTLRWADALASSNSTAQGKLITLTFKALKAADTTIRIEYEEARDYNGNKISFQNTSAKVSIKGTVAAQPAKFSIYGSNLTLGNALDMNFFLKASNITGTGHYAQITRQSGTTRISQSSWKKMGSYYCITCPGISPKEMADEMEVKICNAKGEQVSATYSDSIQSYARRMMNRAGSDAAQMRLYVALLNFGAEAQRAAGYNTGNLANSVVTSTEHSHFAVDSRDYKDILQSDKACHSTSLVLDNQILFQVRYHANSVPTGAFAVASYKDHNCARKEVKTTQFKTDGNLKCVSFSCLQIADCSIPVTVKLYDSSGKLLSTVIDSPESIAARTDNALQTALIQLSDAAYAFFRG